MFIKQKTTVLIRQDNPETTRILDVFRKGFTNYHIILPFTTYCLLLSN